MYNLAIRKCTSPPLLAPRLKIFKWKFTTPPGIEPRICWTTGRHATIWASAASNSPECCRTVSSFCMKTHVPILPICRGISFRNLAGKHVNILRTVQIFPLVSSTFLATWRKTFVDVGFIRTRTRKSGWGCGSIGDLPLSTRLELIVSSPSGINVLTLVAITFE